MIGVSAAPSFRNASWPINGIDFDELARPIETRGEALHVGERHELVLAHRDERCGRAHERRIHAVQIDRFAQRQEGLGAVLLDIVVAAGEQVVLDREAETPVLADGRAAETQLELHGAAIGRHGKRTRKLQPGRTVSAREGFANDLTLDAAPRGGQNLRLVRGAQHDDPSDERRMALGETERHHAAVRCADDGVQPPDAGVPDDALQRLRLIEGAQRREFCERLGRGAAARVRRDSRSPRTRNSRGVDAVPGPTRSGHQPSSPPTMR